MKLIVCLDEENGMMFNHRRQSRDRVLIADMIRHVDNTPLWVSPYSAPLFGEDGTALRVDANPLLATGENEYCFVEDTPLPQNLENTSEILIYRWNRLYPADVYFTCNTSAFTLIQSEEFVGSSHDNITKEIWKK